MFIYSSKCFITFLILISLICLFQELEQSSLISFFANFFFISLIITQLWGNSWGSPSSFVLSIICFKALVNFYWWSFQFLRRIYLIRKVHSNIIFLWFKSDVWSLDYFAHFPVFFLVIQVALSSYKKFTSNMFRFKVIYNLA